MHEDGVATLVIAENPASTDGVLELQRADAFDEQDRELGQDTYCLVVDAGHVHYGGVMHWAAIDAGVRVQLSPAAADELGVERELQIHLRDPGPHALVVDAFTRLLRD